MHQRSLRLSPDGRRLDGEDFFVPAHGDSLPVRRGDAFAVRFHLHPLVKANRHSDGHGVMLVLPNNEVWTFDAYEQRVELEESVYLAGPDGPRRAVQIVIHGHARDGAARALDLRASGRAGAGTATAQHARRAGIAALASHPLHALASQIRKDACG